MKISRTYIFLAFLCLALFSCKEDIPEKKVTLADINWIIGQWQTDPKVEVEVWSFDEDKYTASGLIVNRERPRVTELMNISEKNGSLVYSVLAYGQNDNQFVDFALSNNTPKDLIFKNPNHDFPKSIQYTLLDDYTLKVVVGGTDTKNIELMFFRSK